MDKNQAIKICRSSRSGKEELRTALAWSLGLELPQRDKEADESLFARCKTLFMEEYERQTGLTYIFRAKDGVALASVLKKIETVVTDPTTEKVVENTLKIILQQLPEWYRKNAFALPVIDSKFNQIITAIKLNHGQKQPISDDYKARIVGDLLS